MPGKALSKLSSLSSSTMGRSALSSVAASGADSRARQRLQLQLATSALATVDAVVLDRAVDAQRFGPELDRDFVRILTAGTATPGEFDPPGGISGRPSVVYLRRGIPTPADLAPLLEPR